MKIITDRFGITNDGEEVKKFTLIGDTGIEAAILNYGGIIQSLRIPAADRTHVDVCLGFNTVQEYENDGNEYIGAMIGRYANRIGGGRFSMNGKDYILAKNDGPNHLHGGARGFDKYLYDYSIDEDTLTLSRVSPDMEEGYPGNLETRFSYRLTGEGELILEYDAISDADTLVNLTNHTYFNLSGEGNGDILDHSLTISAGYFSENDASGLPTGKLLQVVGTPFDFRKAKPIGADIRKEDAQLRCRSGYDHNYILDEVAEGAPVAVLTSPRSGISMAMYTTKPCLQLYTGNTLSGKTGKSGVYGANAGVCLEAQYRPNALSFDDAPSPFLKKAGRYNHRTIYKWFRGHN